ncbi:hypothetical protein ACHAWO_001210 [Cyclotella atomus]|uniref:Uncharacterized protein n=1 Tax=Cyclotella atomus TaxID=382360 RepID=A0ABD3PBL3_9STRA
MSKQVKFERENTWLGMCLKPFLLKSSLLRVDGNCMHSKSPSVRFRSDNTSSKLVDSKPSNYSTSIEPPQSFSQTNHHPSKDKS